MNPAPLQYPGGIRLDGDEPGFKKLDLIVSKAAWYAKQDGEEDEESEDADEKEAEWKEDMKKIQREITRYNTVEEMPEYAQPTIQKLMDKRLLSGDGESLDLSADMIRVFVVLDRNGTFD